LPVLQHPRMSRLGLLAAAFSDGSVVLYALPHPGALQSSTRTQVKGRKSHAALIPLCPEIREARSCSGAAAVPRVASSWPGAVRRGWDRSSDRVWRCPMVLVMLPVMLPSAGGRLRLMSRPWPLSRS